MLGSTMTFSPPANVLIKAFVPVYCSAIKGLTLLLMPPVPSPMTTIARMSPGKAIPCSMAIGREVAKRTSIPAAYMAAKYTIVQYLPRYWSAITAPITGVR